jgi:hypothetical protein
VTALDTTSVPLFTKVMFFVRGWPKLFLAFRPTAFPGSALTVPNVLTFAASWLQYTVPKAVKELPVLREAYPRTVRLWTATCHPYAPPTMLACSWQFCVRSAGLPAVSSARNWVRAKTASFHREFMSRCSALPLGQPLPEKETDDRFGRTGGSGEMPSSCVLASPRARPASAATSSAAEPASSPMVTTYDRRSHGRRRRASKKFSRGAGSGVLGPLGARRSPANEADWRPSLLWRAYVRPGTCRQ